MISIIMLTCNRKAFVGQMIEDVLNQTYKEFEFLIVDNGSTDGSAEIVEQYAQTDARIQVIHTGSPYSIGKGRNIGLNCARGAYVAYVDDDDRLEPDYLEFLVNLTEHGKAHIAMCGADEELGGKIAPQCMYEETYRLSGRQAVKELIGRKRIRAGMPTKLIKKELLSRYPFDENGLSEDIHTIYKYFGDAGLVVLHGIPKYHFIRHGGNNSYFTSDYRKITPELLDEYLQAYQERALYLSEKFPEDSDYYQYSVWSFMISMYHKSVKFGFPGCEKQIDRIRKELRDVRDKFCGCSYVTSDEIDWMNRYIKNGENGCSIKC